MATSQNTIDTITNWYKGSLGREPDKEGLSFWSNAASSGRDMSSLQSDFLKAASSNGEKINKGGLIDSTPSQYMSYGGDQVRVDDTYKGNLAQGASRMNMGVQEYDKFLNPTTYGARWGIPESSSTGGVSNGVSATTKSPSTGTDATLLNPSGLAQRNINPGTETVSGQLDSLLKADSPYLQQARARGERVAAGRGLINSTMAGSMGEDSAIAAALQVATPDAATFSRAGDYNTALINQANMYNADTANAFASKRVDQGMQLDLAKMQDSTQRYIAEKNDATSRYNTDAGYRDTVEKNKTTLVNNILMTTDLSPDRKSELLKQLGETGLASAIYVVQDVAADLAPTNQQPITGVGA